MDAPPAGVSKPARAFVYTFLAAFIICGLFFIEAWPLTGWRLFSYSRPRVQSGWAAYAIDASDRETPLPFDRFGLAYRNHTQILQSFPSMTEQEREAICDAYIARARELGIDAARLRVYRTVTDVGDRRGERGAAPARTLAFACGR